MKMTRLVLLTSLTVVMFIVALNGCYSGGNPYGPGNPTPTPTPGATPTQPPSALYIDARTDKIAYNVGDEMVISVLVDQASYLHVFDITPDGQVTRIFPNAYANNNYVQGGQTYIIPSTNDRSKYILRVSEPRGTERLRIVATLDNGNLVPERDFSGGEFAKYNGTAAQLDQAIDQQLANLPAGSYGSVNLTFQVK